nr:hypothetical protein B0A51_13900 [Rachicladosporium sp. CCFEE 5018]
MARRKRPPREKKASNLASLPPELLDAITSYLPPSALYNVSLASKALATYISTYAWKALAQSRFPSTCPSTSTSWPGTARTLCTLSQAWDRRAIVARVIEPKEGGILVWPAGKREEKWRKPRGQTIGFTPVIDVKEVERQGGTREETLVWSAGAQVVVRKRVRKEDEGRGRAEKVAWECYAPAGASEGRDDVTALHLLDSQGGQDSRVRCIVGTAAGKLEEVNLPGKVGATVEKRSFVTDGESVRSSSLLQSTTGSSLLAAQLGDTSIRLYAFGDSQATITANSKIDINAGHTASAKQQPRAWSVRLLSDTHLAAGTGPSTHPISVYELLPTGVSTTYVRHFTVVDTFERLASPPAPLQTLNSVYPIIPLPATTTASHPSLFLSGAYDGWVHMHDLRSSHDVVRSYIDPTDDSGIYSLLARGQESVIVGANSQSRLKIFDLRIGMKGYHYLDGQVEEQSTEITRDHALFLRVLEHRKDSAVYNLASASPSCPHVYAGISARVLELAITEAWHPKPDPVYFEKFRGGRTWNGWRAGEVLELAGYEIESQARQRLMVQSGLHGRHASAGMSIGGLDERWWVK